MNSVFIYYRAELHEGAEATGNVVLEVHQPITSMGDIVVLQDYIAKTFQYKVVSIMNWQRMEERQACRKCGTLDILHSELHCMQGLPQPSIKPFPTSPGDDGAYRGA